MRTQFKYAFSTARCRLCADARVGSAERTSVAAPEGRGVDDGSAGEASLCFAALLEPWRALARRAREARSAAKEADAGAARDPATAKARAKPCGCRLVCANAPVWTNAALADPGTREGGPTRATRTASHVATAASLRRDIAARIARDATGRSGASFGFAIAVHDKVTTRHRISARKHAHSRGRGVAGGACAMGLFSPGKMRFFSPRKKKVAEEVEEPVRASPLGDASTHAAYAAYESSFPIRDRHEIAPVVLHVAVASPSPTSTARAEASRGGSPSTVNERRDRDVESDALSEESRDACETRRHGRSEVADSVVSTSAPRDAEGVDDTAKRLRAEAFPRSLLSCAVVDREKGWIFPSASLWARNPSATHALRFRVQALRHEEVYVVPNRGVLRPGECLELRVTPRPVADLAEDPDTIENGDARPEPNALALVTVAATRETDAADDNWDSMRDEPLHDDIDPGLDADTVRTVVEMAFDVTAAHECARAVAALEHAAALEAQNAATPSETGSEDDGSNGKSGPASERDAALAEAARAIEECSRARREADAHAAAAATASDAAGAAAERLARREAEWEAERATFVSEARRIEAKKEEEAKGILEARVATATATERLARREAEWEVERATFVSEARRIEAKKEEEAKGILEARVATELAKRRKVLDAVLDAMRTRAESAETRAVEAAEAVREALARSASVEAELKLDRETFARRLKSSRAARDFAFEKFTSATRTAFARTALASWRRLSAAAANSRRVLETERLGRDRAAFEAERAALVASVAEARCERDDARLAEARARERLDRDEAGAARDARELAENTRREIETLTRSVSAAVALNAERDERDPTATPPRDAEGPRGPRGSRGFLLATPVAHSSEPPMSSPEDIGGMTRRVDVDVVVDVDASGRTARVVSETVRRVRRVSPASLFARTRDAHRDARRRDTGFAVDASVADESRRSRRTHEACDGVGGGSGARLEGSAARTPAEKTLEARLRVAGDAARRAREPWRPPRGWSPERGAIECE